MKQSEARLANIGAEEGPNSASAEAPPAVRTVARLWESLFEPERPAFGWLPGDDQFVAWLNTPDAAARARALGLPLFGAAPDVVERVHDKAFAAEMVRNESLARPELVACTEVLGADDLAAPDAVSRIGGLVASWPAWAQRKFVLKPRIGTTGRGRAAGENGNADNAKIRGSLPRLAKRGGAILEPWLERITDLSAQILVAEDGSLVLLGTTRQIVSPSGVYRGTCGAVDSKGRVVSNDEWDESLREAAVSVGLAAAAAGFRGPAGIDAFSYRDHEGVVRFRPVVECNARFTMGTIAIGLVRQNLPALKRRLGLTAGMRCPFHFALDAPAGLFPADGRPEDNEQLFVVPLGSGEESLRPALVFAKDDDALEAALPGLSEGEIR